MGVMDLSPQEQKVAEAIHDNPGLDDDELSELTGVKPRQQVNQIAHLLEAKGYIERKKLGKRLPTIGLRNHPPRRP